METLYIKDDKEYYINADGKIVCRYSDKSINYRVEELPDTIIKLLDRARARYRYPSIEFIDNLISICSYSELKAANYVRYKLLGECSYNDVFGQAAEALYQAEQHYKQSDIIADQVKKMAIQLQDMQTIIYNMAAEINRKHYKVV